MEIFYCKNCGSRVSSTDIENNKGVETGGKVFCQPCAKKLGLDKITPKQAKKGPVTRKTTLTNKIPEHLRKKRAPVNARTPRQAPAKKNSQMVIISVILGTGILAGIISGIIVKQNSGPKKTTVSAETYSTGISDEDGKSTVSTAEPVKKPEPEVKPEPVKETPPKPEPEPETKFQPQPEPETGAESKPESSKPVEFIGFEEGFTDKWKYNDRVVITDKRAHSGSRSLMVPGGGSANILLSESENYYGRFSVWVYETGVSTEDPKKHKDGPEWGFQNTDGQYIKVGVMWRSFTGGNKTHTLRSSINKFAVHHLGHDPQRSKGWHKWEFVFEDESGPTLVYDDKMKVGSVNQHFKEEFKEKWKGGFNRIIFRGGDKELFTGETAFLFDDLEIKINE